MLNFDKRLRPPIDFEDKNTNFTESLSYFPEDEYKAMRRCETIKQRLIMSPFTEQFEFVILVTHGFFTQKVPTLFNGKGGYADYCSCSCISVTETDEGSIES
jgi:hypothetical protein